MKKTPSMDQWLQEAKQAPNADKVGMYLVHNGTVRVTARAEVRQEAGQTRPVKGMVFSHDREKVAAAEDATRALEGIYYVRTWLDEGQLSVGDDLMYVLVGGDIRPHVLSALDFLVGKLKTECVREQELYD